jgi:hypothetical protein
MKQLEYQFNRLTRNVQYGGKIFLRRQAEFVKRQQNSEGNLSQHFLYK